ncbi:MAG: GEVED domain-containing protein, partial [Flavobacteriales bacterium]
GAGDSSTWTGPVPFAPGSTQIGSGSGTSNYFPIYSCYGYSYSQQIYLASEYTGQPYITKIKFKYTGGASSFESSNGWTVYLGNTTKTSFSSTTDWVPFANLNQVFSGTVNPIAGQWMEITLNTPFLWDGTSNIVVAVDENTPSYNCTAAWQSFTASANRGIMYYSDGTNPNPSAPPAANQGPSADIAQIQILGGTPPSCLQPTGVAVSNVTTTSANLSWTASTSAPANGYQWEVRTSGAGGSGVSGLTNSGNTAAGITTATTNALSANVTYTLYVRSDCGGNFSPWAASASFYTGYCVPVGTGTSYYLDGFSTTGGYSNINNTGSGFSSGGYGDFTSQAVSASVGNTIGFTATWPTGNTYTLAIWVDWNQDFAFDGPGEAVFSSGTSYLSTPATGTIAIPTGTLNGSYRMRVRNSYIGAAAACGTSTYGEAEDYTFMVMPPPSCLAPTGLTATNLNAASANLSWTASTSAPANGYQWEVRTSGAGGSGASGLIDSGTTGAGITATSTNVTLPSNTNYILYVRSDCGSSDFSVWSAYSFYAGYCISTADGGSTYFTSFTTSGGSATITNPTGYSAGGYGDYTSQSAATYEGASVNF